MKHFVSKQQWEGKISYKHFWTEDDLVVSTLVITHYNNNETVNISGVYVHEDYRQRGIATMMLKETLDKTTPFSLEVRKDNVAAIKLYENFGFHYWQDSDSEMIWMKDFKYSKA